MYVHTNWLPLAAPPLARTGGPTEGSTGGEEKAVEESPEGSPAPAAPHTSSRALHRGSLGGAPGNRSVGHLVPAHRSAPAGAHESEPTPCQVSAQASTKKRTQQRYRRGVPPIRKSPIHGDRGILEKSFRAQATNQGRVDKPSLFPKHCRASTNMLSRTQAFCGEAL